MVKSPEKKMSKLFSYVAEIWILERWILRLTQEKMMGFDYYEETKVPQTKYYYGSDKALKTRPAVTEDLLRIAWKYENRADQLSNNLILQEISTLIFFQFYWKINRNQSQIIVEATYGLNPY